MLGNESEDVERQDDREESVAEERAEAFGESHWISGFSAGLGLHFFGVPVLFFLTWIVLRYLEVDSGAGFTGVWLWTFGTMGVTQLGYMLPAYYVARQKGQPRAYRSGLVVSVLGLVGLNILSLFI